MKNCLQRKTGMITGLTVIAATMMLMACSAKIEGGGGEVTPQPQPGFKFDKPAVAGPDIKGKWLSECVAYKTSQAYRKATLEFTDAGFKFLNEDFSDAKCASKTDGYTYEGVYQFSSDLTQGLWIIDYSYIYKNVRYIMNDQKLQIENGKVYMSDFSFTYGYLNYDLPFTKEGAAAPVTPTPVTPPTPAPVLKPATLAYSYYGAKYAFCSLQGFGVMIDFQGVPLDIATTTPAKAKYATKTCGANTALKWAAQTIDFSVVISNGKPKISFPASGTRDYIGPHSYQSGLSGGSGAYSVFGGNSGDCFFLTNDGTQNIPFTYSCY